MRDSPRLRVGNNEAVLWLAPEHLMQPAFVAKPYAVSERSFAGAIVPDLKHDEWASSISRGTTI